MNLPNRLTVTRLCLVPVFIALYLCPYFTDISVPQIHILFTDISVIQLLAFIVFLGASLTDFLDGYLARKNHLVTTFGKFVDPIADKMLVNSALILLTWNNKMSVIALIVMLLRDTFVDGVRLVASSSNRVLAASIYGKLKTVTQMVGICLLLLNNPIFAHWDIPFANYVINIAACVSLLSGIDYFWENRDLIMESM